MNFGIENSSCVQRSKNKTKKSFLVHEKKTRKHVFVRATERGRSMFSQICVFFLLLYGEKCCLRGRDPTRRAKFRLIFLPLMWEYDYFKAQHRCCSTFSDPHVGIFSPAADLACAVEDLIVSLSRQPIGLSRKAQMENSDQLSARWMRQEVWGWVLLKIPDAKGQLRAASLSDRTISNYFRRFMCQNDAIKSGDGQIFAR